MQANNIHSKIDQQKLNEFMQKAAGDIASTLSAMLAFCYGILNSI